MAWDVLELPGCNLWLQTGSFHPTFRICRGSPSPYNSCCEGDPWHTSGQLRWAEDHQQNPRARSPNLVPMTSFHAGWKLQQLKCPKKTIQANSWYFLACCARKQWREGKKLIFQNSVNLIQMAELLSCYRKETSGQTHSSLKKTQWSNRWKGKRRGH